MLATRSSASGSLACGRSGTLVTTSLARGHSACRALGVVVVQLAYSSGMPTALIRHGRASMAWGRSSGLAE